MESNNIDQVNRYRFFAYDTIIFLIGTVLSKGIQFLLMPIFTVYMTTDSYGEAELINNLSELFFPIVTLCIYESAFRFAVDPKFDNKRLATAIYKVLEKSFVFGIIITIISIYIFNFDYAFYVFFILYSYSINMCLAYYVRGCGLSKLFAISGIISAFSLALFSIIFIVIFKYSGKGYLISIGLSYLSSTLFLIIKGGVIKKIDKHIDSKTDLNILLRYSTPLIFYNIMYWITTISGRYILLWFTDSSTAGKYIAAVKIAAIINMIQQSIYAALQLNTSRAFIENNKEDFYSKITNILISFYCSFGAVIICFTPLFAQFTLKNDFFTARIYLPIIMLSALVNCISSSIGAMYSTYKKTKKMIGVSIVGSIINVVIGILLTPKIGIWGVCIASLLCFISQTVYKIIDIRKFCHINYEWKTILANIFLLIILVILNSLESNNCVIFSFIFSLLLIVINIKNFIFVINNILGKK